MTGRWPIGVALAALTLTGCSSMGQAPPPGPSAAELETYHARMLELTWADFALPPSLAAPPVTPGDGLEATEWGAALHSCMESGGYPDFGYSWSNSQGYVLLSAEGEAVDRHEQMVFYFCVAGHPLIPDESGMLISADELDYVYDYYVRWTVPCLIDHGYSLRRTVSRDEFFTLMGEWAPYWELPLFSRADHERVVALCGPDRPPLSRPSLAGARP